MTEEYKETRPKGKCEKCQEELLKYLADKLNDYNVPYSAIYEIVECLSYKVISTATDLANEAVKSMMKGTRRMQYERHEQT